MIYLDNAATTFPKPDIVYREMDRCMREYCANPGRGGHELSIKAGMAVMKARETICSLFHIDNQMRLCFTKNATEALNIAIKGIVFPGCHVIATSMEHNSVMRPLRVLERDTGLKLTILKGNDFGEVEPDDFRKEIRSNTALIICTLSSNVNGVVMPIGEIGRIARDSGIPFLVDASQGAGSMDLDVIRQPIDLMAFPGHKGLLGPQGTGCLYVREGIYLRPLMEGGTGSNSEYPYQPSVMPDLLESGTINTPGIIGLGAGAACVAGIGAHKIGEYKHNLMKELYDGLYGIPDIRIYSRPEKERNSGIIAVTLSGMDSTELSYLLDNQYGICTRAGLHCAPGAHSRLGTLKTGVVRFSASCMNTREDIRNTIRAMEEISLKSG